MREIRFDRAFSHRRDAENAELKPFFCSSLRPLRLCDKMWVITKLTRARKQALIERDARMLALVEKRKV